MNKIYKNIIAVLILSVLLTSCSDDENFTGKSMITDFTQPNVVLSVVNTEVTVNEADEDSFIVTATIAEASTIDVVIDLKQTAGNADENDYSVSKITIPAGETSSTGVVSIIASGDLEGDETFTLSAVSRGNTKVENFNFTVNIVNDFINDNFIMNIEWCADYNFDFAVGALSGNYGDMIDLDIYLINEATGTTDAMAATGSCPEHLEFGGLDDGSYIAVVYVWDNKLATLGAGATVPLNITYEQEYFVELTDFSHNLFLSSDSPGDTASAGIPIGPLARIVKSGHEFTITTP